MFALLSLVAAAAPTHPHLVTVGSGLVEDVALSGDERIIAARNGSAVVMLETGTWAVDSASPCAAESVAVGAYDETGADVWVGCGDGTVQFLDWTDGEVTVGDDPFEVGTDPVIGLWWDGDTTLWAVTEGDALISLVSVDYESGSVSEPLPIGTGFVDGTVNEGYLYIATSGQIDLVWVVLASGTPVPSSGRIGIQPSLKDIAPAPAGGFFGVDTGRIVYFIPSNPQFTVFPSLTEPLDLDDLGTLSAVAASPTGATSEWMLVTAGTTGRFYDIVLGLPSASVDVTLPATVADIVVGPSGDAYGGSDQGGIVVFTSNPWVSDVAVSPALAVEGDAITVTFTVDQDVDATIELEDGTTLWNDAVTAGTHEVPLVVTDAFAEGENTLLVLATANGYTGSGSVVLVVDNPPGGVVLEADALGFADGALVLSFAGLEDEDLEKYLLFVSTSDFSATPDPEAFDEIESPGGGRHVTYRISELENGVTYYVGVRPVDTGGKEGPMSNVISGTPQATVSSSALAGEAGGCRTSGGVGGWFPIALALALLMSRSAAAADDDKGPSHDLTKEWGDFEMRYGNWGIQDPDYTTVYGTTGNDVLMIEAGPSLFRILQVDAGIGFYQELDHLVAATDDHAHSADRTMMTILPLTLDATLRLQLLDEQVLVPHVRAGVDYVLWQEKYDSTGATADKHGKVSIDGAKWGTHIGFGGGLLLDTIAPARASLLETESGVNDTFLVVDWRRQRMWKKGGDGNGDGLSFAGNLFTIGIQLDY